MSEEEKAELEELYENSEWWHNRFNAVQRDYENLQQKIDKAIEYIKEYGNLYCLKHTQFKKYKQYEELLEILGDKDVQGDDKN